MFESSIFCVICGKSTENVNFITPDGVHCIKCFSESKWYPKWLKETE